jgi:hypothetical protein
VKNGINVKNGKLEEPAMFPLTRAKESEQTF